MKHRLSVHQLRDSYQPTRCWVGNTHKVCYETPEAAELAAGALEYQHPGLKLTIYKCEYGDHWHLANRRH